MCTFVHLIFVCIIIQFVEKNLGEMQAKVMQFAANTLKILIIKRLFYEINCNCLIHKNA